MPLGAASHRRFLTRLVLAGALALVAGCGSAAAVRTPAFGVDVSLPSEPALAGPLAVVVDDSAPASTATYRLAIVDEKARTTSSITPKRRGDDSSGTSCTVARLPVVSASAKRVFYLDGDSTLKFVDPDGMGGSIRDLGNEHGTEVTFAVSPDETRLAVVTVVPTTAGFHEEVSVETLGGAGAVTIFTREASASGSNAQISWPVGWHDGQLVMADGAPGPGSACNATPAPTGYDLVDPISGAARLHFCFGTADGEPSGPPVAAGVLCRGHEGSTSVVDVEALDGTRTAFAAAACAPGDLLNPDGTRAAVGAGAGPACARTGGVVAIVAKGGGVTPTSALGQPAEWLDPAHLALVADGHVSVLDTPGDTLHSGDAPGLPVAVLPPTL